MNRFAPAQWDALRGLVQQPAARLSRTRGSAATATCRRTSMATAIESNEWVKTCPTFDVKTWLDPRHAAGWTST
jgi:hypothetical protein